MAATRQHTDRRPDRPDRYYVPVGPGIGRNPYTAMTAAAPTTAYTRAAAARPVVGRASGKDEVMTSREEQESPDASHGPSRSPDNRVVVFDLPFPLLMREFDEGGEIYVAGSPPAAVGIVRRMNERPAVQSLGVLEGGDPYGRVSYSRVQVRFHVPTTPAVESWSDDDLIRASVDRVNQLVEHYRDVIDDPLARPVSWLHVVHFTIFEEFAGGDRQQRAVPRGAGPLRLGLDALGKAHDALIRARLQRVQPPSIHRMIELDIRARVSSGEYRLAVVDAATLLESWLRPALERAFESNGETPEVIASHFIHANGLLRGVRNVVTTVLPMATQYSGLQSTTEFWDWDRARELRNELVHGHRLTITLSDAVEAIEAIFAAIHHLQSRAGLS
jgi:hypothetical protein